MMEINPDTCQLCGLCAAVCPLWIPYLVTGDGAEKRYEIHQDRQTYCIKCGHCMAVCPTQSIQIDGLSYQEDFFKLPDRMPDGSLFFNMLASRRSIRAFKDKPVPPELLQYIVDAISLAPMGFTPHKIEVTIIQKRESIEKALPILQEMFEKLGRLMANPLMRTVLRRSMSYENFRSLQDHVLPGMKYRIPEMKNGKGDTFTRGAPVLFLFHANRLAPSHTHDAIIAMTYGLLAAHALGLGATALSLISQAVNRIAELKLLFEIPPEHEVVTSMIVGYPKTKYQRGIKRSLAAVHWI